MGKKAESEVQRNKNKNKGKNKGKLGVSSAVAMKGKVQKENPFESIWSRRKFNIMGKKRKNDERRRIGLSRSLSVQKRQKTLLKEYEQGTKSSIFIDKRIGEQNDGLGEFDKAILRSQREQQFKLKKQSKFNLSDGEEDELDIAINPFFPGRDDYEEDEADDANEFDGEREFSDLRPHDMYGAEGHNDSTSMQETRQKSKKEVMEDIISKSKFFKAQKAKDKEENEQLIEQLDKDFSSLVQSKALMSLAGPEKSGALKALDNLFSNNAIGAINSRQNEGLPSQNAPDTYVKLVGEMALEMRARPSDRTKTPEELAQEEKEHLEQLEEERQRRMVANDDPSDEDDDASEDEDVKQPAHVSGDDLGDSFSHDMKLSPNGGLIDKKRNRESASDEEGEDGTSSTESEISDEEEDALDDDRDDSDKIQSLKDWELSDDENIDATFTDEEAEANAEQYKEEMDIKDKKKSSKSREPEDSSCSHPAKPNSKKDLQQIKELPYTIEAPSNFEELCELLEDQSDDGVLEAVRRIRAFNSITINKENRKKMQVFYGLLLQYFAVLADQKPLKFKLLNMLAKPLIEMSSETPYFAAICARERLLRSRKKLCQEIKSSGKSWPSPKTLFLLRLWSIIFPCSDFRHSVMTPASLLISEYLMRCPITSGRDIAIGAFLSSMLLSFSGQSTKFFPEAIMFLETVLMTALNNKQDCQDSQLHHLLEVKVLDPLLLIQGRVEDFDSLDFLVIIDLPDDSPYFSSDPFRASALSTIVAILEGFIKVYEGFISFPEIFFPVSKVLLQLAQQDQLPDVLKAKVSDVSLYIEKKSHETYLLRQPLRLRKKKVIRTEIPQFEENFVKGRDYDPDRERAERKKLKKRLKQEAKGAARELRKDNYFLLEVKEKDKARMLEEKADKYGKVKAFLQEQENAFKSGQLGKGRKGKR